MNGAMKHAYGHNFDRYPDGLGWQLNVSKSALRKTPEFKRFHNFLVYETEVVSALCPIS